jgi:hypothetical protein
LPLKSAACAAEVGSVQILVPCHACEHRKRPLSTCPACHAAPDADLDLTAWRLALHANHLARITAAPFVEPAVERPQPAPLRLVMTMDDADGPLDPQIAAVEPLFETAGPRSFDWDERHNRRLRRSADAA